MGGDRLPRQQQRMKWRWKIDDNGAEKRFHDIYTDGGKKNKKTIHWEWQMAREWIDVPFTPNLSFCYMFINQISAEFKESRWFKICCAERWNSPLIILQKEKVVVINRHIQIGSEYYIL